MERRKKKKDSDSGAKISFCANPLHIGIISYAIDKWKVIFRGFTSFDLFYPFSFVIHRNRNVYNIC